MLRAISEMAVAMMVRSLPAKPIWAARSRPVCRAATISPSRSMGTRVPSGVTGGLVHQGPQHLEALIEVERGGDTFEREAELDHGEGHVGLDADDDHGGAAQLGGLRDAAQHPCRKGIQHVEHADV